MLHTPHALYLPSRLACPLLTHLANPRTDRKEGPDWGRKDHHDSLPKGCLTAWASRALSRPYLGQQETRPPLPYLENPTITPSRAREMAPFLPTVKFLPPQPSPPHSQPHPIEGGMAQAGR